ncbi:metallophosphoesterase [Pseudonocardiaceae bacterium YIM PH 21723]|nr:metallophosphoesterase [Pseudonocardiaceae bacterium YIM PH 21723]
MTTPRLWATSDLHISYQENRKIVEEMHPPSPQDWLIVAGDVADQAHDVEWALRTLKERFAEVIWVPGNHELWTLPKDPVQLRGETRYKHLVELCRNLGVHTPEDEFVKFGDVTIAPLFLLYDYTFRPEGATTKEEGLKLAYDAGVVCTDEHVLFPDPYPSREAWCAQRLEYSEQRLSEVDGPTILVNHWPTVRQPTEVLYFPVFAQWCGTVESADWHTRFNAECVVYGHLHIPRTTEYDGVRFEEVSVGYPREWKRHNLKRGTLRQILPVETP